MKTVRNSILFAIALLALFSSVFAYVINVSVSDVDYAAPSKLPGTKVQVLSGNTVVYEKTTDKYGNALFNLSAGTYFVRLNRSFYPEQIIMYTVHVNETLNVKMNIKQTTYTLYGQVVDNPSSKWEGKLITVMDAQGQVFGGQNRIAQDGYYLIPYLYPGQTFQMKLEMADGQKFISAPFSFSSAGAYWLPLDLSRQTLANATPALSAPARSQLYAPIVAFVRAGDKPLANESVSVGTPDGALTVLTDANGAAPVYAASPGTYEFAWNGQSAKTVVEGAPQTAPPAANVSEDNGSQANASENATPSGAPAEEPAANLSNGTGAAASQDNGTVPMTAVIIGGIAAVIIVAVIALAAMGAWKMLGKKNDAWRPAGSREGEMPEKPQTGKREMGAGESGAGKGSESPPAHHVHHPGHAKHPAKHGHGKKQG